jgi:hypothetical protein
LFLFTYVESTWTNLIWAIYLGQNYPNGKITNTLAALGPTVVATFSQT